MACLCPDRSADLPGTEGILSEPSMSRSVDSLAADFARLPYARYAPVRRQLLTIHRAVNEAAARTGFSQVPISALKLRRAIVQPFGEHESVGASAEGLHEERDAAQSLPQFDDAVRVGCFQGDFRVRDLTDRTSVLAFDEAIDRQLTPRYVFVGPRGNNVGTCPQHRMKVIG